MSVTIRDAREQDAAAITTILSDVIADGRYSVMSGPIAVKDQLAFMRAMPARGVYHVALDAADDRIVGLQDVQPASVEPALAHVGEISTFVALDALRRGVGRALCTATFAAAKVNGYRKLIATIRTENDGAVAFYRSVGFGDVGTLRAHARVRGVDVDQVLMERCL